MGQIYTVDHIPRWMSEGAGGVIIGVVGGSCSKHRREGCGKLASFESVSYRQGGIRGWQGRIDTWQLCSVLDVLSARLEPLGCL